MMNKSDQFSKEYTEYFVDIHVIHSYEMIKALSKYLKDNGYKYNVNNKGKIK